MAKSLMGWARWLTLLGKFFRRPPVDRLYFIEAVCWLGLARLAMMVLLFRWIAPVLGRTMAESPHEVVTHMAFAAQVAWAVEAASRHIPWESKCLARPSRRR